MVAAYPLNTFSFCLLSYAACDNGELKFTDRKDVSLNGEKWRDCNFSFDKNPRKSNFNFTELKDVKHCWNRPFLNEIFDINKRTFSPRMNLKLDISYIVFEKDGSTGHFYDMRES